MFNRLDGAFRAGEVGRSLIVRETRESSVKELLGSIEPRTSSLALLQTVLDVMVHGPGTED